MGPDSGVERRPGAGREPAVRGGGRAEGGVEGLRVLVLHPRDRDGETLVRQAQRLGCEVRHSWPPAALPGADADAIVCLVDDSTRAHLDPAQPAAVVAVVAPGDPAALKLLAANAAHAVILKPVDPAAVLTNLIVAHNNARYERRLLSKISKLEETLRSARKVERAKAILMQRRRLDEPEAYAFLRTLAMRRRVPIGEVATAVIESSEMLSGDA
jgi:AmiR/NasT family two-component response regulator